MIAAGAMTVLKLAAGLLSGSLGVLSDAAHSGLDLVGAALTFFSVQVSDKPADEDHTYGHGKVENLSAFCEAILMALSCAWIIWEALNRIIRPLHGAAPLDLAGTRAVDFNRRGLLAFAATARGGAADGLACPGHRRLPFCQRHMGYACRALLAWARVGRGRAMVSAGSGTLTRSRPWWSRFMILRLTLHLGRETVAVLMDEVPAETRLRLVREVEQVDGVMAVEQARVRRAGAGVFRRSHAGAAPALHV